VTKINIITYFIPSFVFITKLFSISGHELFIKILVSLQMEVMLIKTWHVRITYTFIAIFLIHDND
jgi:hypothetical protein